MSLAGSGGDDRVVIEIDGLTKRYGSTTAVQALSFTVQPGRVTGFLGPNGAGKSTTMRLILGLDRADAGAALVNGRPYRAYPRPLHQLGALLETRAAHPGRSAHHHLLWLAQTHGIPRRRIDEVLELVGLASVARRRVGTFSLGMTQRLGVATALLGDPAAVVLDEPMNGLDPEGMVWIRGLLRDLAGDGRTVLVSSHLMSEMEQLADHLVVIGRGRRLADTTPGRVGGRARFARGRVPRADPRCGHLPGEDPMIVQTRGGFGRALLAEWTKFRTVRSTLWTPVASSAITLGLGMSLLPGILQRYDRMNPAEIDPVGTGVWYHGLHLGQVIVGVLGVLLATSEYGTGTIRATFAAIPSRGRVLAAKWRSSAWALGCSSSTPPVRSARC